MTILDVENLSVSFQTHRGIVPIISNISFDVKAGETVGIVGESGSGKSVTAMSLLRLIPKPPLFAMSGSVLFDGRDLTKLDESALRVVRGKEIAMIFQEPMTALNPVLKIGDQIVETIRTHMHYSKNEAKEKAISLLEEVGIPEPRRRMNSYPHELSGGQRQRAMIAMALSCSPKLLIADEPTTALDVTIQAQVLDLLKRLSIQHQMSVLFITHDLGVIAEIADRVVVMHDGQVKERGTVGDIFNKPTDPYTKYLLSFVSRGEAHD